jgi:hypothetical protein
MLLRGLSPLRDAGPKGWHCEPLVAGTADLLTLDGGVLASRFVERVGGSPRFASSLRRFLQRLEHLEGLTTGF